MFFTETWPGRRLIVHCPVQTAIQIATNHLISKGYSPHKLDLNTALQNDPDLGGAWLGTFLIKGSYRSKMIQDLIDEIIPFYGFWKKHTCLLKSLLLLVL
ncbi:hypothetical protein HMPREF0044_0911 [Gleimia coleocanis DSM 15436]|uniref:Uncharacterized protein n=1 Tax=Gleimia coleocanis DSM 15436 TaxID=525245 RepID=C0W033_9ACTO|nr:hypothetical protein [Gleimia coleocanis]EEH63892.1 hypothetical protein HMPREF0044_0911 [Gleimia coleocanis DSM 15436]